MTVSRLGGYAIYDVIASGGMANVHFGRRVDDGSALVAIKRVDPSFAAKDDLVAALQDEGKIAAFLRHPNVLTARDVVVENGEAILVIDYVHGGTLAELGRASVRDGVVVPLDIASAILADVLRGLGAAHAACDASGASLALVHRDLTPQNVLVGTDGVARVADFGVAQFASREARTRTGQVKGKLTYLSPEQVHGSATPRSDLFSLAVTTWELLAGRPLFAADTDAEVLARVLAGPIPRISTVRSDIPPAFDDALARALSRPVEKRFADAAEMAEAIARAVPPASAASVGVWVAKTLAGTLAERAAVIARIDAASPEAEATVTDVAAPAPIVARRRATLAIAAFGAATLLALSIGLTRSSPHDPAPAASATPVATSAAEVAPAPVPVSASVAPPAPTPPPPRARPAARERRADCDPPFVIDEQHHKHYKPQCFGAR